MTVYSIALFLHVLGALGAFIALGLEWAGMGSLQRVTTIEQAREWLGIFRLLPRIGPASLAALLLSGLYMTGTVWGWGVGWINVTLASLLLFPLLGGAVTGRRLAAIEQAVAAEKGAISPTFRQQVADPFLWASMHIRTAVAVGIIFLMTVKPGLSGALLTMGVATVLGLALTLPRWNQNRLREATRES